MHHTKYKGDIGITKIISDLTEKGFNVLLPISEHLPFDLVVFNPTNNKLYRIQCKFRKSTKGVLMIPLRTSYADKHGTHSSRYESQSFDIMAVYSPDYSQVLYISEREMKNYTSSFTLRIDMPRPSNNGVICDKINYAKDYTDFPMI